MAAFDFPAVPALGEKYPVSPGPGIPQYTWDGQKWTLVYSSSSGSGGSAANVTYTPSGTVAATNVQLAIEELGIEKVAKSGGADAIMTGHLTLPTGPAAANAVRKDYVDSLVAVAATVNPLMDGVAAVGIATKYAREDHKHPSDTTIPPPSSAAPPMNGTAAIGSVLRYAREDHVHASDTSRAALASPIFTGDPQAPTPATADNDTSIATTAFVKAQGYAPLASPVFTGNPQAPTATVGDNDTTVATTAFVAAAVAAVGGISPSATNPLMNGTASPGVATGYSRGDHVHPTDTTIPAPATVAPIIEGTAAIGVSTKYAREDHVHPAGTGGTATTTVFSPNGNISATNVQTAIQELDTEKVSKLVAGDSMLGPLSLPVGTTAANSLNFGSVGTGLHGGAFIMVNSIGGADILTIAAANVTSTKPVVLPADPTNALEAATKQMVDTKVTGPASATADNIAVYNGATGKIVKDGGVAIAGLATSTHTHVSTNITDFAEAVDDRVGALLVAGTNITLNYNDAANTLSITAATGAGGTAATTTFTPAGNIAATNVQTALQELDTEKLQLSTGGTLNGNLNITAANTSFTLNKTTDGNGNNIVGQFGGLTRWLIKHGDNVTESAGNNGSDWALSRWDNAGASIGDVLKFTRSTGLGTVAADPTAALGIATKQYIDAKAVPATATPLALGTAAVGISTKYAREDHVHPPTGAGGTAASTTFAPAGNIAATDVQAALVELDNEKYTVNNNVAIAATAPLFILNKSSAAGDYAGIISKRSGNNRWIMYLGDYTTEPGSLQVGSDFVLQCCNDGGTTLFDTIRVKRGTGLVELYGDPVLPVHAATKRYVDTGNRIVQTISGSSITLASSDAGTVILMANATAQTLTVPPNSSVAWPAGTQIEVVQTGAGQLSIAPGAGVTLNSDTSKRKIAAQYGGATLIRTALDVWVLVGNLAA